MHASRMGRVGDRWRRFGVADDIDIDDLPMENKKIWQQTMATIGAAWLDNIAQGDSTTRFKSSIALLFCAMCHGESTARWEHDLVARCSLLLHRGFDFDVAHFSTST